MSLTFERKLPIILFFVFVMLVAVGIVSYQYTLSLQESTRAVRNSQAALLELENVLTVLLDADWYVRGFYQTGNSTYADGVEARKRHIAEAINKLRSFGAGDPARLQKLDELEAAVNSYWALAEERMNERRISGPEVMLRRPSLIDHKSRVDNVREIVGTIKATDQAAANEYLAESDRDMYRTVQILILASVAGVISLLVANFLVWSESRRRAAAESALVDANRDLENRIAERTEELRKVNESLKAAAEERETLLVNEQAARREAEVATRLRDEFMATVSHELRTPLNSILGWARMLRDGTLDEKQQAKALGTIIKNSETQNRLIEDLLDVARLISGKLELEKERLGLGEVLGHSIESVMPAAKAKGIKIFNQVDTTFDAEIVGDQNRMLQVFANLLTNSIKFTPPGGSVRVKARLDGEFAEVSVTDTGSGITPGFLPIVFERFRQDMGGEQRKSGLGLGLAIVRNLVEMHGGSVRAESEGENKGSTFIVRLPTAPQR